MGRTPAPAPHHPEPATWSDENVTVAWLGHATVLINFFGLRLLTDPTFFPRIGIRIGPFTFGPKRFVECALTPSELPPLDALILSHAHMDHLDLRSLRRLARNVPVITARGVGDLLRRFRTVHELGWGETLELTTPRGGMTVTALKLRHWGSRLPWETHRSYNAFLLERRGVRLCFTGDTARTDATHLGARGPIDLMIVPISAYNPWITNHCTPEEAIAMAREAGARRVMPVHHETFKLSSEPLDEPIRRFQAALAGSPEKQTISEIGQTFVLPIGRESAG